MLRAGLLAARFKYPKTRPLFAHLTSSRAYKPTPAQIFRRMADPIKPLQPMDGPLVWIDCEMTGLDHRNDKIIEIAVLITNGNLDIIDEGVRYAIKTDKEALDKMDDWCTKTHFESGLTAECLASTHTLAEVEEAVLAYVKRRIPTKRSAVLAGSSVHVDRQFLCEQMPKLIEWLHYRIVDCSTIKELASRWYPDLPDRYFVSKHRALDDIRDSISDLARYRRVLFKTPEEFKASQAQSK
ncbi:ribonuclease H-like protein [Hymenopellis radicata]|nr:ribonuclease H-like protein [Hymenopellis radicata]